MATPARRLRDLVIGISVAGALGVLGVAGWSIHRDYQITIGEIERNASNIALVMEQHAEHISGHAETLLGDLAFRIRRHADTGLDVAKAAQIELGGVVITDPYRAIIWLTPTGKVTAATRRDAIGLEAWDRDYHRAHVDRTTEGTVIGTPIYSRADGVKFIPVSRAVRAADGGLLGVAMVAINPRRLGGKAFGLDLGPNGVANLLRSDGTLLTRVPFRDDLIGQRFPDHRALTETVGRQPAGTLPAMRYADGEARTLSYRADNPWRLITTIGHDRDQALAPWRRNTLQWLLGVAVILAGIGVSSVAIDRQGRALERERQRADRASQDKDALLANMSHELRTPLNAVIGFSEIMKEQVIGPLPDRYRSYAGDILASGRHLLELINNLLELSKIGANRRALTIETIDLPAFVDEVLRELSLGARERGVRVELDLPPDVGPLRADYLAARQILTNLLTNAIKFTRDGGRVTIQAGHSPGDHLWLRVRDTGIGIAAEQLLRLGERFFQADPMVARNHGGSGLGLALVKLLMAQHGGTLKIESVLGAGTVVTVLFPARQELCLCS